MYVAGATRPEMIRRIRKLIPDHFLLIPGIGTQEEAWMKYHDMD